MQLVLKCLGEFKKGISYIILEKIQIRMNWLIRLH